MQSNHQAGSKVRYEEHQVLGLQALLRSDRWHYGGQLVTIHTILKVLKDTVIQCMQSWSIREPYAEWCHIQSCTVIPLNCVSEHGEHSVNQ